MVIMLSSNYFSKTSDNPFIDTKITQNKKNIDIRRQDFHFGRVVKKDASQLLFCFAVLIEVINMCFISRQSFNMEADMLSSKYSDFCKM